MSKIPNYVADVKCICPISSDNLYFHTIHCPCFHLAVPHHIPIRVASSPLCCAAHNNALQRGQLFSFFPPICYTAFRPSFPSFLPPAKCGRPLFEPKNGKQQLAFHSSIFPPFAISRGKLHYIPLLTKAQKRLSHPLDALDPIAFPYLSFVNAPSRVIELLETLAKHAETCNGKEEDMEGKELRVDCQICPLDVLGNLSCLCVLFAFSNHNIQIRRSPVTITKLNISSYMRQRCKMLATFCSITRDAVYEAQEEKEFRQELLKSGEKNL